jgi:hypothetical protein
MLAKKRLEEMRNRKSAKKKVNKTITRTGSKLDLQVMLENFCFLSIVLVIE